MAVHTYAQAQAQAQHRHRKHKHKHKKKQKFHFLYLRFCSSYTGSQVLSLMLASTCEPVLSKRKVSKIAEGDELLVSVTEMATWNSFN